MSNANNIVGKTVQVMIDIFKDNEIGKVAKEWCEKNNIVKFNENTKKQLIEYLADYIMNKAERQSNEK